jgi:transposase
MARTESIDTKRLIASILKNNGIISAVAKDFGVSSYTIYQYRNKYASVAKALEEARYNLDSTLLDGAELKLNEAIRNGEAWAIRYVLKTKGTGRGYIETERREVTGADGQTIAPQTVIIQYADSPNTTNAT